MRPLVSQQAEAAVEPQQPPAATATGAGPAGTATTTGSLAEAGTTVVNAIGGADVVYPTTVTVLHGVVQQVVVRIGLVQHVLQAGFAHGVVQQPVVAVAHVVAQHVVGQHLFFLRNKPADTSAVTARMPAATKAIVATRRRDLNMRILLKS